MDFSNCSYFLAFLIRHFCYFSNLAGILQNASVFSALALKTKTSDKIEIYKTADGLTDVLVNNETVELVEATSDFDGVRIERHEGGDSVLNFLLVFEREDLSVSVDVSKDLLNVLVMISGERYKGSTAS